MIEHLLATTFMGPPVEEGSVMSKNLYLCGYYIVNLLVIFIEEAALPGGSSAKVPSLRLDNDKPYAGKWHQYQIYQ
jgi:hypothetical protein